MAAHPLRLVGTAARPILAGAGAGSKSSPRHFIGRDWPRFCCGHSTSRGSAEQGVRNEESAASRPHGGSCGRLIRQARIGRRHAGSHLLRLRRRARRCRGVVGGRGAAGKNENGDDVSERHGEAKGLEQGEHWGIGRQADNLPGRPQSGLSSKFPSGRQ